MPGNNLLKRGFATKAEQLSIDYRAKLSLQAWSRLDALELADFLHIKVYSACDFIQDPEDLDKLAGINGFDNCGWSALTMPTEAGNRIIIHNPFHSEARQQSDIMHELSHIICEHKQPENSLGQQVPFWMRTYDATQEAEANFLGAALLLSKACLFWALKREMAIDDIARHFVASIEMVNYRLNISGVAKQVTYKKRSARIS